MSDATVRSERRTAAPRTIKRWRAAMTETSPRGKFVWYDLLTTDPNGATDFYTKVAGWGTQEWNNPVGAQYTMWTTRETPIGGVMKMAPEMQGSMPPHWIGYVAVPNVDESAN